MVAQVCLIVSAVIVTAGALARGLGHPLNWTTEMAGFFFAWAAFLSADVAMRHDRHVAVEILVQRLPHGARCALRLFNYTLILGFLGIMIWYGTSIAFISRFRAFQGIPGFSYMWVTLSVPAGSLLLAVTTVRKMGETLKAWRDGGQAPGVAREETGNDRPVLEERA
ncbi:MAG: TRAP transporter small permease subunit [Firmicutes bacterium]|nr:TRAP transporter small permease subunit [Bacillota bacterium]